MIEGFAHVLNWNIAGAKYLELPKQKRERFRHDLNQTLQSLIDHNKPLVVALQELVRYDEQGDDTSAQHVIDTPAGYDYIPEWLIDTRHQSARRKWEKVRELGGWPVGSFFAQGNGFLVRQGVPRCRVFDLPAIGQAAKSQASVEAVKLESGLYLGSRDTEPRAALILHLVLDRLQGEADDFELDRPLDLFVVNLHLTTLTQEREGVPAIDDAGTRKRLGQVDVVLNQVVSPYNSWRKGEYRFGGAALLQAGETVERYSPVWVIAGDFNFTPESPEYRAMIQGGFMDLIPSHRLGTKTAGLGRKPTLTVDYVFAGPKYESIDPGFVDDNIASNHVLYNEQTRISDHFPLIVSVPIALRGPEKQKR